MRDKAYRRAAGMCATCATREGRKKHRRTLFLAQRMETPHDKSIAGNPTDTLKWVPNTNIPAFLEQHPDRAHTATRPTHQRRRGSDLTGPLKLPTLQCVVSIGKFNYLKATALHLATESPLDRSFQIYLFKPCNTEEPNPVKPNHHFHFIH